MSDEIIKPAEETVSAEPAREAVADEVVGTEPAVVPVIEPIVISEPVFSPPAKGEMPEAEGVETSVPIIESTLESTQPTTITPPAESHLPLAGQENSELIISSPSAKGESERASEPTPKVEPVSEPNLSTNPVVSSGNPEIPYEANTNKPEPASPVVVPVAIPVTHTEPPLVTSNLSLEPNPRPYSLDPKLNKMIESFVKNMNKSKENLVLAQKATKAKMMKRVYRVIDLFKNKKSIKNDDVEKFLHISDDTATKYLNILTKEGKVKREGSPHNPHYTKVE